MKLKHRVTDLWQTITRGENDPLPTDAQNQAMRQLEQLLTAHGILKPRHKRITADHANYDTAGS